ncbi:hypothetical protein FRC01_001920, partial [Tulasnella sp. 417]
SLTRMLLLPGQYELPSVDEDSDAEIVAWSIEAEVKNALKIKLRGGSSSSLDSGVN